MPVNELVEADVQYCTTDDVERYIRNKSFDATTDPTESAVQDMILEASETVDDYTRRAWRERKVADRELPVEMDHTIESSFERKRRQTTSHGFLNPIQHWANVYLPNQHVKDIQDGEGDSIEVLLPEGVQDITSEGGTRSDDSLWYLDGRKGILYVDPSEFRVGPIRGSGMLDNPQVRVTYRYGQPSEDTTGDNVPDNIPRAITTATAKLVAADLIDTDQYGSMLASGPENTPNQSSASERLRSQVWDRHLPPYRDARVML